MGVRRLKQPAAKENYNRSKVFHKASFMQPESNSSVRAGYFFKRSDQLVRTRALKKESGRSMAQKSAPYLTPGRILITNKF
jgi:hypothetical protein